MATLPDLAWGVGGKVVAVHYPAGWATAAAMINADPRPVAVLPADSMRQFSWAGTRRCSTRCRAGCAPTC